MSSIFLWVVPSPTIVRSDIVTPGYFSDLMNYYSLYSSDSVILLLSLLQRDPSSGKSKGFGFVSYGNQEDASRAIAHLHGNAWEKNDYRLLQVSFKREK